VQAIGERQGVVAPDRNKGVDLQAGKIGENVGREVPLGSSDAYWGFRKSGAAGKATALGLVREVCRMVPPERSMVRTSAGVSGWRFFSYEAGSSGL
jgi:hypothetical protein